MNTQNQHTPEQTYNTLLHADYQHEPTIVRERIGQIDWNSMAREQVSEHAQELVQSVRQIKAPSWMQAMLNEYQLSNPEGLALMSLAEAVLRVPDVATRMALLEDKVADKDWAAHKSQSDSTVVNAATRGLILLEQVLDEQRSASVIGTLKNLIRRVAAINTSPEPFSNVAASVGEDAMFAGGMWALLNYPLLFLIGLAIFIVLASILIYFLWRFIKVLFQGIRRKSAGSNP